MMNDVDEGARATSTDLFWDKRKPGWLARLSQRRVGCGYISSAARATHSAASLG